MIPRDVGFILSQLALLISCLVVGLVAYGFYDRRLQDFVLGFIGAGAGYLLFIVVIGIITVIVVIIGLLTGVIE